MGGRALLLGKAGVKTKFTMLEVGGGGWSLVNISEELLLLPL